jgi:hypothetical protein
MADRAEQFDEKPIRVLRGRVDSLTVYEVTDYELSVLEQGSPSSTYFNFAIALLSVFASFLITLLTTDIKSQRTFDSFLITTIIGFLAGAMLMVLWYRSKSSVSDVLNSIHQRIPATQVVPADSPAATSHEETEPTESN